MGESAKRLDFKDKILPDLEVLLQFSLSLTKNGRDTAGLMREARAEAYRSGNESMPEESGNRWLYKILTRQSSLTGEFDEYVRRHIKKCQ